MFKVFFKKMFLFAMIFSFNVTVVSFANPNDPVLRTSLKTVVGFWQTIDNKTGKPDKVVQITQRQGVYYGEIMRIFDQNGHSPEDVCIHCPGDFHNQPILHMQILWGMRKVGINKYAGGQILNPSSGDVYRATLKLEDHGKVLKVRGYMGFVLFGRTELWGRVFRVLP